MAKQASHLFGQIREEGATKVYTATSDWQLINAYWQIKMYPVHPEGGEPLEKNSVGKDAGELLPSSWKASTMASLG